MPLGSAPDVQSTTPSTAQRVHSPRSQGEVPQRGKGKRPQPLHSRADSATRRRRPLGRRREQRRQRWTRAPPWPPPPAQRPELRRARVTVGLPRHGRAPTVGGVAATLHHRAPAGRRAVDVAPLGRRRVGGAWRPRPCRPGHRRTTIAAAAAAAAAGRAGRPRRQRHGTASRSCR